MPIMLTSLGAKLGLAAGLVLLIFSFGFYSGHRWTEPQVQAARLALANQVAADAGAAAAANAQAVQLQQAADALHDSAVAAHERRLEALLAAEGGGRAATAAMAGKSGDDGPVAPVLANMHDLLATSQGVTP